MELKKHKYKIISGIFALAGLYMLFEILRSPVPGTASPTDPKTIVKGIYILMTLLFFSLALSFEDSGFLI